MYKKIHDDDEPSSWTIFYFWNSGYIRRFRLARRQSKYTSFSHELISCLVHVAWNNKLELNINASSKTNSRFLKNLKFEDYRNTNFRSKNMIEIKFLKKHMNDEYKLYYSLLVAGCVPQLNQLLIAYYVLLWTSRVQKVGIIY